MGAGNFCGALYKERGGCSIPRGGGSLLAGPWCHCPGQILPASVLNRRAPMHSSVGQRGWLPPLPPGPKSKSRAWGLEGTEIREGERMEGEALHLEGLNDAGLEHRGHSGRKNKCVCVCVCVMLTNP